MLEDEFHDAPSFSPGSLFDKYANSHLPFVFMESENPAAEWLNYHHLRYFHAVAREGSISGAAEKLRASQPSICAQVKQLESALGETLYRRSGRSIVLTDFGRLIYGYADEILALGRELLTVAKRAPTARTLRLHVGILDSFPKLLSLDILRPAFAHEPPVQVTCHEGKLEDLLGQLASHRLDALLADEPPPSSAKVKTFCHALGTSGVTFCASPALRKKLTARFPRNLHGAPLLLPTQNTALRRDLEKWFRAVNVEPVVVGEFEDAAFAKIVATEGIGITVVPTVVEPEAIERYGFVPLGKTTECQIHLYLITAERRIEHPALALLANEAGRAFVGKQQSEKSTKRRSAKAR
jgi:LysR family transcriptional activator of nhaA